jgi:hypothetical protein
MILAGNDDLGRRIVLKWRLIVIPKNFLDLESAKMKQHFDFLREIDSELI